MTLAWTDGWPEAPEALPVAVADNHCHLDHRISGGRRIPVDEALRRAGDVGITRIVQASVDVESSRWAVRTAEQHPAVVAAVAIHPNDAAKMNVTEITLALEVIDELAANPVVRAIGETGLDYFRTGTEGRPRQQDSFRRHIDIAKRHDRALVIHDRDAHDDVLAVLDEVTAPERWIMHCFSGDADFAEKCLERGAFLSFAGTVTFKNAPDLREALAMTPLDRILVETDAPFLTPEPNRGKPNASFLIPDTVRLMATTRNVDVAELCSAIDANTSRAYGGDWTRVSG